ncbi:hypothetical protein U1Q18_003993 [Sarracenia purpurea var. burkii]
MQGYASSPTKYRGTSTPLMYVGDESSKRPASMSLYRVEDLRTRESALSPRKPAKTLRIRDDESATICTAMLSSRSFSFGDDVLLPLFVTILNLLGKF